MLKTNFEKADGLGISSEGLNTLYYVVCMKQNFELRDIIELKNTSAPQI